MSKQPLKYLKNEVIEDVTASRIREYEAKAVAPANVVRVGFCRRPYPRLDRLPHVILHRGGIHHGTKTGRSPKRSESLFRK
jgi:hypothetical protein